MYKSGIVLAVFFCIIFSSNAFSQDFAALQYEKTIKTGMYTLLGWSIANISVGTLGNFNTTGSKKYFYQMNAGWNLVNLSLAAGSLISINKLGLSSMQNLDLLNESNSMAKLFLFNGGLDVGYVAFGAFLNERGKRLQKERLTGFGNSLMLQGAFLFVFDLYMYALVNKEYQHFSESLFSILPTSSGIGLVMRF